MKVEAFNIVILLFPNYYLVIENSFRVSATGCNVTSDEISFIVIQNKEIKDKIQDIISKCPGKYIYVGPFAPNVYFEFRKLNATPYPLLMTSQSTPAQFENALEYLKNIKPLCAILNYPSSLNRFKYNKDNLVDNYIKDKYYLVYSDNTTFVYRLK